MSQPASYIAEVVSEYSIEPSRVRLFDAISAYGDVGRANEGLGHLTGVQGFFPDCEAFDEFRRALQRPRTEAQPRASREWGDFQTPPKLAAQVCRYLTEMGIAPRVIIEPTCGAGNFILAALRAFPTAELVYGVEIQEKYEWQLKLALLTEALAGRRSTTKVVLRRDDIFTHRFPDEVLKAQDLLIIGNPPWVTSAELGTLDASNLPVKRNLKALKGMDALTGKSNFDIGEFVLLRMLELFAGQRGTLAMLCKNSTIKNIVEILPRRRFKVANIRAFGIDAGREFGAGVDASLLVMELGAVTPTFTCQVAMLDQPDHVTATFGWTDGRFVSNIESYEPNADLDGHSPMVWRQGLKHDCARVMELDVREGQLVNGSGEVVDVEAQWVYWLLKSSDLRSFEVAQARKKVIVPQRCLGEDTSVLQQMAPKLWGYLDRNSAYFEKRKSSIYRVAPRFAIFGVGAYMLTTYKVAISGLYKQPFFALVLPMDDRPVMLDDTCYYLGFDTYLDALFTASALNSALVKRFLAAVVFADAKRPYTKEVLMRIDLVRAVHRLTFQALVDFWADVGYRPRIAVTEADFEEYRQRISKMGAGEDVQFSLGI